jgi:hypothetical protein
MLPRTKKESDVSDTLLRKFSAQMRGILYLFGVCRTFLFLLQPIDEKGYRWAKVLSSSFCACFLSALLRLESKLIGAACREASVIRGIFPSS